MGRRMNSSARRRPQAADGTGRNDVHGEMRESGSLASTADPSARLCRKGKGNEPSSYSWGRADHRPHPITLGADKACNTQDSVNELRVMRVTAAHVGQKST
jgi:hypothetical protein